MAEKSKIGWTDSTFNPWIGCAKVSAGCKLCYAEAMSNRYGWVEWGVNGTRKKTSMSNWLMPTQWNKKKWVECPDCGYRAATTDADIILTVGGMYVCGMCLSNKPMKPTRHRVFCASLADVFEEREELAAWRSELFGLINATPNLDWLILTKRPENIASLYPAQWPWPDNIWLGTTVENQAQVWRIIPLLEVPARVHFVSVEPMLSAVDLNMPGYSNKERDVWVICGGESGAGCRPMQLDWARDLRAQCQANNVPFFMKQLGGHPDKRDEIESFPEDLQVREFPE
jgi:protein gp37